MLQHWGLLCSTFSCGVDGGSGTAAVDLKAGTETPTGSPCFLSLPNFSNMPVKWLLPAPPAAPPPGGAPAIGGGSLLRADESENRNPSSSSSPLLSCLAPSFIAPWLLPAFAFAATPVRGLGNMATARLCCFWSRFLLKPFPVRLPCVLLPVAKLGNVGAFFLATQNDKRIICIAELASSKHNMKSGGDCKRPLL
eukprot:TRINITY_DN1238_c0_g1_i4.p1 TRINITY_DN1238_c0_g1~~TRINITY_DN1238_c0_g1_i4.p1  ORF type:complete len:195 (+),score=33.35 TRINITY_DN1238_c0_g1_i4:149-733(+)